MFANPEVSAFIDRLIGGQTPHGGAPPPAPGYRGALARGLLGDLARIPPVSFTAPSISVSRMPEMRSLPSEGVGREVGTQNVPPTPTSPSSGGNTGASGLTSGLNALGGGIEGALDTIAAKKKARDAFAAEMASHGVNMPSSIGGEGLPAASPASGGGGTNSLPSFARPGIGTGPIGSSIGVGQFLNGIKAGEGVPYSGQSPTGAIGAYGLTGGFIKQWAPGAGLPSDRASYMNSPSLQDKLATHAATEMYNKFGSWPLVANAWLTGSPTAASSAPGNMSPSAYVNKVMNAASRGAVGAADRLQDQQQDAADTTKSLGGAAPAQGQQPVIPGQGNPHLPGFDASSVPFINTPIGPQGMLMPPQAAPQVDPLALALAGGQMPPIDPNFGNPDVLFG